MDGRVEHGGAAGRPPYWAPYWNEAAAGSPAAWPPARGGASMLDKARACRMPNASCQSYSTKPPCLALPYLAGSEDQGTGHLLISNKYLKFI